MGCGSSNMSSDFTSLEAQISKLNKDLKECQAEKNKLESEKKSAVGQKDNAQKLLDNQLAVLPKILEYVQKIPNIEHLLAAGGNTKSSAPPLHGAVPEEKETHDNVKAENHVERTLENCSASECDVMISLNVRTAYSLAEKIKLFLNANRIKVWMCTGMEGGLSFRDEIAEAVDSCKVFLILMNDAWALSGECKYEFEYAQRVNLTKGKPIIVPILFSDLDWNKYAHVRLLLANTNGLPYKEDNNTIMDKILHSLNAAGVKGEADLSEKEPAEWTAVEVSKWLSALLTRNLSELTGKDLITTTDNELNDKYGLSEMQISHIRQEMKHEPQVDPYEAVYDCQGATINGYDQNRTESNHFKVFLKDFGVASSGMVWGRGTLHANYDEVTCVWQGTYNEDGEIELEARYSNNTYETYTMSINDDRTQLTGKYLWYGYGRKSSGFCEFSLKQVTE